jgi:hypothetical protein
MKPLVLAAVVVVAASLTGCTAAVDAIGSATGNDNIFSLTVGDCFDDATGDIQFNADGVATTVDIIDCGASHQFEIYESAQLDDGDYPGADAVSIQADDVCYLAFEGFAGAPFDVAIGFTYTAMHPTEESWTTGDREVLCAIAEVDGETALHVTGSLKDAAADLAVDTSGDTGSDSDG